MPDYRRHRGPHPEDENRFADSSIEELQEATFDLSWLLTRGYPTTSALKVVGDRYGLDARQRTAVSRCACSEQDAARRNRHRLNASEVKRREVWIDGYNVLTSIEAALSGGVILRACDDCYRDMASMHGSYRRVDETVPAILLVGRAIAELELAGCRWLLDQPVSNSGKLKTLLFDLARQHGWDWTVELVPDPDPVLCRSEKVVGTADSQILDHAENWLNLARLVIDARVSQAWIVDLSGRGRT